MRSSKEASCAAVLYLALSLAALVPMNALAKTNNSSMPGAWNSPLALALENQQHWRNNWPAMVLGVLLIAALGFIIFQWQQKQFRKRTYQLENLVSARTMELALANADLERLSITDPLTGLKNRRFLEFSIAEDLSRVRRSFQCVQGEWQHAPEESAGIGFLLVDIDHFKRINDSYGHPAGDMVLRQLGAVFSSIIRESDTTVRWGGEEFLIIARSPRGNDPATLAERIRKHVESSSFAIGNKQTIQLTCSIGFASWPFFRCEPDALGWQEVIALADRCLYLAKNGGRNAWIGLSAHPDYKGKIHARTLNDLKTAEEKGIIRVQSSTSGESARPLRAQTSYPIHVV